MLGTISGHGDAASGAEGHALQHLLVGPRGSWTLGVPCDPALGRASGNTWQGKRGGGEKATIQGGQRAEGLRRC